MEGLKHLDDVAYVRFASVYRNFREAKDFESVLDELTNEPQAKARRADAMATRPENGGLPGRSGIRPPHDGGGAPRRPPQSRPDRDQSAVGCVIVRTDGDTRVVVGAAGPPSADALTPRRWRSPKPARPPRAPPPTSPWSPARTKARVPPCSEALVAAGVARVVTAMEDPDPRTAGRHAVPGGRPGIAVTTGVLAEEAARAHSGHINRIAKGRPHVTLKLAVSADGMIGRREGERMIITSKPAFDAVQAMRATFDVVMVGIGTVLVDDDPKLTVRLPALPGSRRRA